MRVTLIHNPTAGEGEPPADALLAWLRGAGHEPVYHSTKAGRLEAALQDPGDVVVVAGGDGTICEVARWLLRMGVVVPITPLPVGTANNVARTLGLEGSPAELIAGLASGRRLRLDAGIVEGVDGARHFVEAAGFGGFAEMMAFLDAERHRRTQERIERSHGVEGFVRLLRRRVRSRRARNWRIEIDGADFSGRYVLAEIMNIRYVGPNLLFAPDARPEDGALDVVLIRDTETDLLDAHLAARLVGAEAPTPLPARRAKRVRIGAGGARIHIDDETFDGTGPIEVRIDPGALEILLPERRV